MNTSIDLLIDWLIEPFGPNSDFYLWGSTGLIDAMLVAIVSANKTPLFNKIELTVNVTYYPFLQLGIYWNGAVESTLLKGTTAVIHTSGVYYIIEYKMS